MTDPALAPSAPPPLVPGPSRPGGDAAAEGLAEALLRANAELQAANEQLQQQQVELEHTNQQLQEQQTELEAQAGELEAQQQALLEQAAELEAQAEALHEANAALVGSERRARLLLDSIADGFFAIGPDWRITFVNPAAETILGQPAAALVGRELWEAYPGLLGSPFEGLYRRAMAEGTREDLVAHYPDHERYYHVAVYPHPAGGGAPASGAAAGASREASSGGSRGAVEGTTGGATGIALLFRDVSAEQRAQAALRASEARFRAVHAGSPDGFQLCEILRDDAGRVADFRYAWLNDAGLALVGRTLADMEGQRMLAVFPGLAGDPLFERYREVAESGVAWVGEIAYQKDGVDGAFRVVAVRLDADTLSLAFSDLTPRLQAERAAAAARDALAAREAQYRALVEVSPQVVWLGDATGAITYCSPLWYAYTGQTEAEALGSGWADAIHPDHRARVLSTYLAAAADAAAGGPGDYEIEIPFRRASDGTYRWFLARGKPERGADAAGAPGPVTHWIGVALDIDDRKQAELAREALLARVQAQEAQLAAVLAQLPVAVWVADAEGRLLHTSDAAAAVYGGAPHVDSAGEYHTYEAYWPAGHPRAGARLTSEEWTLARTLRTGVPITGERLEIARFDTGERRQVVNSTAPIRDAAGRLVGGVACLVDVTEREATLRALEEARRAAEEANRAKGDFLANMSHELRTPLNAISGYVQLMEMGLHGPVTESQREALGRVGRAQQHLLGLITDILSYAKLESGRIEYSFGAVDVAALADDVVTLVSPQIAAKGLTCAVRPASTPVPLAWADQDKVAQVLLNLVSNAIKFTPTGGSIAIDVDRATPRDDGEPAASTSGAGASTRAPAAALVVRVRDTGLGIPGDQLERVFEPFVQVHRRPDAAAVVGAQQGTGLGLAISRDLARAMGGELTAASVPGAGTTFTFTLPMAPRAGDAGPGPSHGSSAGLTTATRTVTVTTRGEGRT